MTDKTFDKHKLVIDEYLSNGFNGVKAYQAIYPKASYNTADKGFRQIHENPRIKNYASEKRRQLSERCEITKEMIIAEHAKIAFSDVKNIFDEKGNLKDLTKFENRVSAAISSLETDEITYEGITVGKTRKVKLWNKQASLEAIAKLLGYNLEKPEINVFVEQPLFPET